MSRLTIDSDAVIWSAPERERAGRPLLLLLHGYGSHEGDLFGLAPRLPLSPVIASIRAPLQEGPGYAWFPQSDRTGPAADSAAVAVLEWLDQQEFTTVGLLGFSQGGAMALQLLRHRPRFFAYAVQLSGFVMPIEHPGDDELAKAKVPVFWGRGTTDEVIPESLINYTQQWLPYHSTMTERIYEGIAHSVSEQELLDLGAFLRIQLAEA